MELKEQIALYRRQAGFSIEELATRSGVPLSTVKKISAGITKDPQVETLRAIAYAMGKTLDDFKETDLGTTVIDYKDAQEQLRIFLTEPEYAMLRAFQDADPRAREDAYAILKAHQVK